MDRALALAAVAESAVGLALLAVPSMAVQLLFGSELADVGRVVGRVAWISLIALGLACWPGRAAGSRAALTGTLTYGVLATLYLGSVGFAGEAVGVLLWPAVALHAALSVLLAGAWIGRQGRAARIRLRLTGERVRNRSEPSGRGRMPVSAGSSGFRGFRRPRDGPWTRTRQGDE